MPDLIRQRDRFGGLYKIVVVSFFVFVLPIFLLILDIITTEAEDVTGLDDGLTDRTDRYAGIEGDRRFPTKLGKAKKINSL
jgi:hypothetical protein